MKTLKNQYSIIFIVLFFLSGISEIHAENESSVNSVELQIIEFTEHYSYGWRGVADGSRVYWTFSEDGSGVFVGYERIQMIPAEPKSMDLVVREFYNRIYYTGGLENPLLSGPIGPFLFQNAGFYLSRITAYQMLSDAGQYQNQKLHRAYVGFQTPPREYNLGSHLYFLPGLDVLAGSQYGDLSWNGTTARFHSYFLAIEPNFRFRLDLSSRWSISLLLPARFIWISPVSFYRFSGKRTYATDVQGGVSLGVLARL